MLVGSGVIKVKCLFLSFKLVRVFGNMLFVGTVLFEAELFVKVLSYVGWVFASDLSLATGVPIGDVKVGGVRPWNPPTGCHR